MKKFLFAVVVGTAGAGLSGAAFAEVLYDLTGVAPTPKVVNGATLTRDNTVVSGSGVLNSFVRLSSKGNDVNPIQQGYNTNVNDVYNNGNDDAHNKPITFGQVGLIDSGSKMRFILDINERGNAPFGFLNLDEIQIYLSTFENPSDEPSLGQGDLLSPQDSTLVYQMDFGGDNRVLLDGSKGGSGHADMFLDIPISMFDDAFAAGGYGTLAAQNGAFIYLYSRFGSGNNGADAGFEEWGFAKGTKITEPRCIPTPQVPCDEQDVPEPGSLALLGIGALGLAALRARRRRLN